MGYFRRLQIPIQGIDNNLQMKYSLASVSLGWRCGCLSNRVSGGEEHDVYVLSIRKHLSPFPALITRLDMWELAKIVKGCFLAGTGSFGSASLKKIESI